LSIEESQKTIQLKGEIDNLVDQRGMTSSEESSSHDISQWDLSPHTRDKLKLEAKYQRKLSKAMDTFIDRVENHSSSGSCSGDEKQGKNMKKRKYTDFLTGLLQQN